MQYRHIAVAVALQRYVDAPPVAERQRDLAFALAKMSGARVSVLSVEAPVALAPSAESLEQKLEAFVQPLVGKGFDVEAAVRPGSPVGVVRTWIQQIGADLLIIGSHSKQSPLDITMGSTASQLWNEAPCPVILVRPTPAEAARAKAMMIPHYPWVIAYV